MSERARIVARARHDLRAQDVRLLFEVAAVSQHQGAEAELAPLCNGSAQRPAQHGPAERACHLAELQPGILRLGGIGRSVAKQHVGQLVRHHAGDLALSGCRIEHATVNEHRSARQGKRVDLLQVHGRERVLVDGLLQFGRCGRHESIAERAEIAGDAFVVDDRILLANFGRAFAADHHVLLRGVLVLGQLHRRLRG